jgi:Tfp pilus assembly protein PilV
MALNFQRRTKRGFLLLECMLAVAIFAIGIITLGKCVQNCLRMEQYRREDGLAQRALANHWLQIETGAIPLPTQASSWPLKGAWTGMTMHMFAEPLQLKNEKEQELFGLYQVKLRLEWQVNGEVVTRDLEFTMYPRQR